MRVIKYALTAVSCISLATMTGCANHENAYMQQAQQVKPLKMPEGVNLKEEQNYYPTPNNVAAPANTGASAPSLLPPGSDLQRFKSSQNSVPSAPLASQPRPALAQSSQSVAKFSQNSDGDPVLVIAQGEDAAWTMVAKALKEGDYQILDKDRSMSSFYVLDIHATKNQITEKTPIYRVYLQSDQAGSTTNVSLLSEKNFSITPEVAKKILQNIAQHIA